MKRTKNIPVVETRRMLAKTKGGKEFVAARVVVCCARKEAVVPEKLKAFVVKDGGICRVKTSESINVFDPVYVKREAAFGSRRRHDGGIGCIWGGGK